jgi:uncharacterized membrane-anchored protein
MNRTAQYLLAFVFGITATVQLAVPLSMISRREAVLRAGSEHRFQTRPVDPYDAFRGRYVALGFEHHSVAVTNADGMERGRRVYVSLETDAAGFSRPAGIAFSRPMSGDYLKTRVEYVSGTSGEGIGTNVIVQMPFDRFYMNEEDAPATEAAFNTASRRDGAKPAYARVRILNGMAVLEDLVVEDTPVRVK